ncbi:MAG: class I SAM-dependent methyltransferase [Gammaproteobacteria bacterium]|nr:class I SAM-dependent methyltransferase [Gammaproteobacteria bacterium]
MSTKIDYHLLELEISQAPSNEHHSLPVAESDELSILDIGCGIGQTLVSMNLDKERFLVGIDIDFESLSYGKERFEHPNYLSASADSLPFDNGSFDLVISRVALPYTNIPKAIHECSRVLKPGGRLWLTLHPAQKTIDQLKEAIKTGNVKNTVCRCYILLNGLCFHYFGKVYKCPINRQYESFQTSTGMLKQLSSVGFQSITITEEHSLLAIARKPI